MYRLRGLFATAVIGGLVLRSDAVLAHPPYFTESRPITLANGETASIRVLAGDGVVLSDPLQVIIVTSDGSVVASTPTSSALHVSCKTDNVSSCRVSDPPRRRIYVPDEAGFSKFAKLESDERGPYYPEYDEGGARGFTSVSPAIPELLLFEFTSFQPFVVFALSLPIWGVFASITTPPQSASWSDIRGWLARLAAKLTAIALVVGVMIIVGFSALSIAMGTGSAVAVVLLFKKPMRRPEPA